MSIVDSFSFGLDTGYPTKIPVLPTVAYCESVIMANGYDPVCDRNNDAVVNMMDVTILQNELDAQTYETLFQESVPNVAISIPPGSTINSVSVGGSFSGGSGASYELGLKLSGVENVSGPGVMSRPGGGSWTWSDIANLYMVARVWAGGNGYSSNSALSGVFVEGDYTIPAAPTVSCTSTNGSLITIQFSKTMANPVGQQGYFKYQVNGGADQTFSAAALNGDTSKIDLICSGTAIVYGNTITVKYTVGGISASDFGILASFSGQAVTNNVTMLNGDQLIILM